MPAPCCDALPDATRRDHALEAIAGTVPPLSQAFDGCRFAPRCARVMPHCAGTIPELIDTAPGHSVRCLLYVPGAAVPAPGVATAPAAGPAAQASRRAPQRAGETPLLSLRGLGVGFPIRSGLLQRTHGHFEAVRDVSFDIQAGETLALVGESGCGKTTIGKAIVQLLRGAARIDGEALLDGRDLFAMHGDDLRAARRRVQIIFQDPFASLNPRMRVFELLEEGLAALQPDLDAATRRERIETLTDRVGLRRDALSRYPHEFSGGQRQRIAIARALAVQPDLIVCDEPTSALDVSVQAQILNLLRDLQQELGVSYLFITHNIGVVEYIADRVVVMQSGRIVEQGDCGEVMAHPKQAYTRTLLAAVPRLKAPVTS